MNIIIPDSWLRDFLKTQAKPSEIAKYLSLCGPSVEKLEKIGKDTLYYIEVTSNRPDAFSVFGIAREATVILPRFGIKAQLIAPHWIHSELLPETENLLKLKVKITGKSLCPRFTAIVISNVKIGPSPQIIQDRLNKVGIRAINNIVDVSNYIMYELGQPMHTFDYDKIISSKMILRESEDGEQIVTLDGIKRILPKGIIVIEDKDRLIDLCGIMGGENSQIDNHTKNVLLFVQTYNPVKIRKACQLLKFRTEAASRFEKGLDREGVTSALKRAVHLIKETAGGQISSELIDIYQRLPEKKIKLNLDNLSKKLGIQIEKTEVINILTDLGFKLEGVNNQNLAFIVPSFRYDDIEMEEDLIEEVARIYGYHKIEGALPKGELPGIITDQIFKIEEQIKLLLKHLGFFEVYTNSLISEEELTRFHFDKTKVIKVSNPLSSELEYLRPTLLPSLVKVAANNQFIVEKINIFEIANIYKPKGKGLPEEILTLTLLQTNTDYFETKGIMEAILKELMIRQFTVEPAISHYSNYAIIKASNKQVGVIGQLPHQLLQEYQFKTAVNFVALQLNQISKLANQPKPFELISKYPASIENLSLIVDKKLKVLEIEEVIDKIKARYLKQAKIIEVFSDNRLHKDKKVVNIQLKFASKTRTLTQTEISRSREELIKELINKIKAEIRS